MTNTINNISPKLKKYEELLLKTKKEFISISTKTKKKNNNIQSKLGGIPYWPKSKEFVKIKDKNPALMAQINLEEVNKVGSLPNFPKMGILQFYYKFDSDMWGLSFDENVPSEIKVIYHENVENDLYDFTEEEIKNFLNFENQPFEKELHLSFEKKDELLGLCDEYFNKRFNYEFDNEDDDIVDELYETLDNSGSKLDGYAHFTQCDPRNIEDDKDWILLLQLDTDDNMMFGDCGVANWFITRKDLEDKNFDNVYFNWDCL